MTSSVDTAETPRVRRDAVRPAVVTTPLRPKTPPLGVASPPLSAHPSEPVTLGRCELRAERRATRRQRRRYALLGIGVLVGALAATVTVLDVIR